MEKLPVKIGFETCATIEKKIDIIQEKLDILQPRQPIDDLEVNANAIANIIYEAKTLALILQHHVMIAAEDIQVLDELLVSIRDMEHESKAIRDTLEKKLQLLKKRQGCRVD